MNTATATAPVATLPASELNASQRTVETRLETSIPGVYLTVATSHHNGHYWSRTDRVQIKDGILTMKIDRARFSDVSPVAQRQRSVGRYSAKGVQAAQADYLPLVEEKLAEAIAWAERY